MQTSIGRRLLSHLQDWERSWDNTFVSATLSGLRQASQKWMSGLKGLKWKCRKAILGGGRSFKQNCSSDWGCSRDPSEADQGLHTNYPNQNLVQDIGVTRITPHLCLENLRIYSVICYWILSISSESLSSLWSCQFHMAACNERLKKSLHLPLRIK